MEVTEFVIYLNQVNDKIEKFLDLLKFYTEKVELLNFTTGHQRESLTNNVLDLSKKIKACVKKIAKDNSTENLFIYYANYYKFYDTVSMLVKVLDENRPKLELTGTFNSSGQQITEKHLIEANETLDTLVNYYLIDLSEDFSEKIINFVFKKEAYDEKTLIEITSAYKKAGPETIDLYIECLEIISNKCDASLKQKLFQSTQELKFLTLKSAYPEFLEKEPPKISDTSPFPLWSGKFVPYKNYTIPEVMKFYNITKKSDSLSIVELVKIIEKSNNVIGIVVLNKTLIPSTYYNDCNLLIDKDYIYEIKLNENKSAGVSEKTLERTATIKPASSEKSKLIKDSLLTGFPKKCEKIYVWDLLGDTLRLLMPWFNSQKNFALPISWWKPNFDENNYYYTGILSEMIAVNITAPLINYELTKDDKRSNIIRWNIVRNDIKKEILDTIKKSTKNSSITKQKFIDLVNSNIYSNALQYISDEIIRIYLPEGKNLDTAQDFIKEVNLSLKSELDYIKTLITKQSNKIAQKAPKKIEDPVKFYGEHLDEILKRIINEKSNIYMKVEIKSTIWNYGDTI